MILSQTQIILAYAFKSCVSVGGAICRMYSDNFTFNFYSISTTRM